MVQHPPPPARHTAAKREKKKTRSSLAARLAGDTKQKTRTLVVPEPSPTLSKSALRRRKHKQRDQLAGNKEGLRDLADELDTVKYDQEDVEKDTPALRPASAPLTAKSKRRMLSRERARQPYILSDLQQSGNPFAALRTHARNTLDLRRANTQTHVEVDEEMAP
ncbi:hypothetical protein MBRA1_002977 [Malassezia brasiliensis]|uniref:Ribosome biogenesis protein SLX9 n=1 Tax=Malassezia brasiliensis TaxID=1821822 RepID=A0AAF0DU34_9BASI|nr:hypothetical protein MBRA1_002977 [Malassezia brasiliensis]